MAVSFGLPGENHGQIISHKVVSSTPRLSRVRSYKNRNPDRKNSTRETKLKKKITFCRQIYGLCCCIRTTFWVCMMFLSCLCGFLRYRYLINISILQILFLVVTCAIVSYGSFIPPQNSAVVPNSPGYNGNGNVNVQQQQGQGYGKGENNGNKDDSDENGDSEGGHG